MKTDCLTKLSNCLQNIHQVKLLHSILTVQINRDTLLDKLNRYNGFYYACLLLFPINSNVNVIKCNGKVWGFFLFDFEPAFKYFHLQWLTDKKLLNLPTLRRFLTNLSLNIRCIFAMYDKFLPERILFPLISLHCNVGNGIKISWNTTAFVLLLNGGSVSGFLQ